MMTSFPASSNAFNSLFKVLFICPSQYLYAIDFGLYLLLAYMYMRFAIHYQES